MRKIVWTVEQEKFLREHINDMSTRELGVKCGHPGIGAMYGRIRKLGLKKKHNYESHKYPNSWTAEQEMFLRENVNAMPVRELGERCGRLKESVGSKLRSMGLKKDVKTYDYRNKFPKTWTVEQEQFLRDHKDDMTLKELGKDCGNRSVYTVAAKIRNMGLKKTNFSHRGWITAGKRISSNTEFKSKHLSRDAILSVYPEFPLVVVAEKLNVSFKTLYKEVLRHKIEIKNRSYYTTGKPRPHARERMLRLWRSGYFADKLYPFPAPNKAEDRLLAVIQELGLPFRYVGDWKYQVGTLNPDFVHMSKPVCIDLFGSYWHSDKNKNNKGRASYIDADVRTKKFNDDGHKLLVVYENELRDLESLRNKLVEYAEA